LIIMWTGRWLDVDLTDATIKERRIPAKLQKNYIGGRGLGVRLLCDHLPVGVDPFSEENQIFITTGPISGLSPLSARHCVVTKSPLTGTIFDSSAGGFFGISLRRLGFDAVQIRGRSELPSILSIDETGGEIEPAGDLWGMNTAQVFDQLEKRDPKSRSMVIGQAGEKLVRYACIICDRHHALGRGGIGAVMGSKNLKGVVIVTSERKLEAHNGPSLEEANSEAIRLLRASPVLKGLKSYGTASIAGVVGYLNIMPFGNFRHVGEEEAITGESMASRYKVKRRPCQGCFIGCKRVIEPDGLDHPEYETLWAFGPNLEIDDPSIIIEANRICNQYGMDTISAAVTIAACAEQDGTFDQLSRPGIIKEWLLRIGQGLDLAAQGSLRAAPEFSMNVKGLELPGYDPAGAVGQALSYATSNRGGCHLRAYMVGPEIMGKPKLVDRLSFIGKPGLVYLFQNMAAAVDSLIMCKFSSFALGEEEYANLLSAAVGINYTAEDLLAVGERIYNLERLFNQREGFGRKDDSLPMRVFERMGRDRFDEALSEYYRWRGWDEFGAAKAEKLEELGLVPL
jgi:aldehyde:ferredoxin oxidoreductase